MQFEEPAPRLPLCTSDNVVDDIDVPKLKAGVDLLAMSNVGLLRRRAHTIISHCFL